MKDIEYISVKFVEGYQVSDSINIVFENSHKMKISAWSFEPKHTKIQEKYSELRKFIFKDNTLYLLRGVSKNRTNNNPYVTHFFIKFGDFSHKDRDNNYIFKAPSNASYKIWQFSKNIQNNNRYKRQFKKEFIFGKWMLRTTDTIDDSYKNQKVDDNYQVNNLRVLEQSFNDFYYNKARYFPVNLDDTVDTHAKEFNFFVTDIHFLNRPLEVTLKQKSYKLSDTLEIEIQNRTYHDRSYTSTRVQKYTRRRWITIRDDIECPCKIPTNTCKKMDFYVKGRSMQKQLWDFKDNDCNVLKGKYRLQAFDDKDNVIGESKAFNLE